MEECNNNISNIALNLTKVEFKGYCKGMELHWFFKANESTYGHTAYKRSKWWNSAYDKYKHDCAD